MSDDGLRRLEKARHDGQEALERYRLECARAGAEVRFDAVRVGDLVRAYDPTMECVQHGIVEDVGPGFVRLDDRGVAGLPPFGELGIWTFREALGDTVIILMAGGEAPREPCCGWKAHEGRCRLCSGQVIPCGWTDCPEGKPLWELHRTHVAWP